MKKISKANIILLILTILICFITIGYSFLETSMSVGGVADIKGVPKGFTANDLINKANPENKDYNSSTEAEKGEMYTFSHPATEQTPALTDYRYIGNKPNNYIIFNNETWRIIGVFEGRIKIIRDESIGNKQWDDDINEWSLSTLKTYLNSGTYWTTSLTQNAKDKIDTARYYLGGTSAYKGLGANDYYYLERGNERAYDTRSLNWDGKIGLMYPSDYAYTFANGVDNKCFTDAYYCDTSTPSSSWLYNNKFQWTISPNSAYSSYVFFVYNNGYVDSNGYTINTYETRPVAFLKSDIMLSGSGTVEDKYTIVS